MPIPTSPTWDLADFDESTIGSLLTLGSGVLTITPSTSPYFSYNGNSTILTARSVDGVEASLAFDIAVPAIYTFEFTARFTEMPHNVGDLLLRRLGFTVADDDGRGVSVYLSKTGVAVARIDDHGSVTALEGTSDITEESSGELKTIRIAVDSGSARAYVFFGDGTSVSPETRFVLPIEKTPPSVPDTFKLFVKGTASEPASMEITSLKLGSGLVMDNFPPTADAGGDRVTPVGEAVRLDGRASFDVEGAPISYRWRLVDAPMDSDFAAEVGSGSTTDDGDADGVTATLNVPAGSLPSWLEVGDVLVFQGVRADIASFDDGTGVVTVELEELPDDVSVGPVRFIRQALSDAASDTPYFVPDAIGLYRLELVVNDGISSSEAAEVVVSAVSAKAPFALEPDISPLWRGMGDDWSLIEGREIFEEFWKGTSQILAGKMLEVWQYNYNFNLRDAQRVLQQKWVPFQTLLAEESPDDVEIGLVLGVLEATHEFENGDAPVTGLTLILEMPSGTYGELETITVTFTGDTLFTIVDDISGAGFTYFRAYPPKIMSGLNMFEATGTAVDDGDGGDLTTLITFTPGILPSWVGVFDTIVFNGNHLEISSVNNGAGEIVVTSNSELEPPVGTVGTFTIWRRARLALTGAPAVRVNPASTAAAILGIPTGVWSTLHGAAGSLITDRTYYVGNVNLDLYGVTPGSLLVLNNGQSFRVDRVLSSPSDPMPNQRLLLVDPLPADASPDWSIPTTISGGSTDYELGGVYPGDLLKAEAFDEDSGTTVDIAGVVVAQKGTQLAVDFDDYYGIYASDDIAQAIDWDIRILGVKRRKAIPIDATIKAIPRLQDVIPVEQSPTIYQQNIDYILEPFYRDVGGAPLPMIQFRDSVFVDTDTEPPDLLWAELVLVDNEINVENLFGRLTGFLKDDASAYSSDFNYVAGVAGLMYSYQRGPNLDAIGIGAQILFGQSFAEVAGVVEEIRNDFSPTRGRITIRDADGNTPTRSEVVRTYYYKKDPLDLTTTSGLAINPDTEEPWAVGDSIEQFSPIGAGIDIIDTRSDPRWYVPYVRSGLITELEKFHHFLVTFNLDVVTLTNLALLLQFVYRVKPDYTFPLIVGLRNHEDDIDITDEVTGDLVMSLYDSPCGDPHAWMYDDYAGDGTIYSSFDDGDTYFDAHVDCPTDIIEFEIEIDWAGGVLTYDSGFFFDVETVDVSGAHTGTPGSTFVPEYDMTLVAGTYIVTVVIKSGGVVLP